jgi:hypothetical protein
MKFWLDRKFWLEELFFVLLYLVIGLIIFFRTGDFSRSFAFFLKILLFMQPILLLVYFVEHKFSVRKSSGSGARNDGAPRR